MRANIDCRPNLGSTYRGACSRDLPGCRRFAGIREVETLEGGLVSIKTSIGLCSLLLELAEFVGDGGHDACLAAPDCAEEEQRARVACRRLAQLLNHNVDFWQLKLAVQALSMLSMCADFGE